jgi:hypothetical protein
MIFVCPFSSVSSTMMCTPFTGITTSVFFTIFYHSAKHGVSAHKRRNKWVCLVLIWIYMTNTCLYSSYHLLSSSALRESHYYTFFGLGCYSNLLASRATS